MTTLAPQVQEIERALNALALKRSRLAVEKTTHQAELSRLKDRVRGSEGLPPEEYRAICRKQNEIKGRIVSIEADMATIRNEMREKEVLKSDVKLDHASGAMNEESLASIRNLRQKYMEFAADATRVSSMRQMAAQFVQELELIG